MWIAFTILLATFVASFTDWLFMDVLVHRFYLAEPQVWRPPGGRLRIVVSQIVGTLATAAAVLLGLMAPRQPIPLALVIWAAGALPISVQNWQWMRLNPVVPASHATGWLIRLLIATLLTTWLVPR
jgi:hypothetical protein